MPLPANALPFIVQIALLGAAGTQFVSAHLKNLRAADLAAGKTASERWRVFRHPHRRPDEPPAALALRRAALTQTLWGGAFLAGAFAARALIGALHLT